MPSEPPVTRTDGAGTIERIPPLIALCACGHAAGDVVPRLQQAARAFTSWDALPARAEVEGVGPLLYARLREARVALPPATEQALRALTLRHRAANSIRFAELRRILDALQDRGVDVLVLKGAALAHIAYETPGLRPMRDLDLLVPAASTERARDAMLSLGYEVPAGPAGQLPPGHHHLPPFVRHVDGMLVSVEIHHRLLLRSARGVCPPTFDTLRKRAVPFELAGGRAYTLGCEDLLWHLYTHGFGYPMLLEPFRMKYVADIAGLVDRRHGDIDWAALEAHTPRVHAALRMIHFLTPFSEPVMQTLRLAACPRPRGVGRIFNGSPAVTWAAQRALGKRIATIVRDTFFPSEWWMRLYYGMDSRAAWPYYRLLRHPVHMLYWGWRCLCDWKGNRRHERSTPEPFTEAPPQTRVPPGGA